MNLHPWVYNTSANLTFRGWHSAPTGKPVLHFLHGNGFCSRTYEPMLQLLAGDFDLWLTDLQGHGESDQGQKFLGWKPNALLASEVFPRLQEVFGAAPRYAVGHSLGGVLTSYILAGESGFFRRAVLLDPVLFTPAMLGVMALSTVVGVRANRMAARAMKRRGHWPSREAAFADLHGRGIFKGWTDAALHAHIAHALKDDGDGVALRCPPAMESAVFGSYPKGLWGALRKIRTPTLMLHGKHSYPFVARSAQRFCHINPQVMAHQVPGGHCFMQEFPEDSARRTTQFLLG